MTSPVEFPNDENGDVLRRMQEGGDDLTKCRDIDFSCVFPSQSSAGQFADHFRRAGLKVGVEEGNVEQGLFWDVTVTRYMLPTHAGIAEVEENLAEVAAPLGGRNDGWGCIRQFIREVR